MKRLVSQKRNEWSGQPKFAITLFIQLLLLYLGLEKRWYDIILGVCGSISIVLSFDLFAIFVSKNNKTLMISKALLYFGRNTMLVYILHGPFYRMCLGVMSKLFKYDLAALRESVYIPKA
jgi:isoprenylcysteine carboxyl methyltransferase (ICMT) family protein YpbQ